MDSDPVRDLVEELGAHLANREHSDIVLDSGGGERYSITPSGFSEIRPVSPVRRVAFVDGGHGLLDESPSFLVTLNRTYCSIFRGSKRISPRSTNRIQLCAYVISDIRTEGGKKRINYRTRLFAGNEAAGCLPREADLSSQIERSSVMDGSRLESLVRRFSEWSLARHVVENELESGDVIVMDGSLQTAFKNEIKYANGLYEAAMQKGVVVCGLSKTSRLITDSGDPLLARIAEIAEEAPFETWYAKVADGVTPDDRGFMLAVRLHEKSRYVFRFEILREQFRQMDSEEINAILYSLAANSNDVAMLGYPYGAIDADRFAQVRKDETDMYRGYVLAEKLKRPEWRKLQKYGTGLDAHEVLNRVTS